MILYPCIKYRPLIDQEINGKILLRYLNYREIIELVGPEIIYYY